MSSTFAFGKKSAAASSTSPAGTDEAADRAAAKANPAEFEKLDDDDVFIKKAPASRAGAAAAPGSIALSPISSRTAADLAAANPSKPSSSLSPSESATSTPPGEADAADAAAAAAAAAATAAANEAIIADARDDFDNRWHAAVVLALTDFLAFLVTFFSLNRWEFGDLAARELEHYNMSTSLFDMALICMVRCLLQMYWLSALTFDKCERPWAQHTSYWVVFTSLVLVVCKIVVWDFDDANGGYTAILLLSFFAVCGELYLAARLKPSGGRHDWDPAAEEDREAALKRLQASEQARAEAAAVARTLSGSALAEHNAREAARVQAAEYVERQLAAASLAAQHKQTTRYADLKALLRPYFWPDGMMPRVVVGITWAALIASKVLSIIAPLFIGRAVDVLVNEDRVPWLYISLYCGFMFGSNGLKQVQNAVYLRVKQEAFVQIAKSTFRHLHALSLQWHLKKKMGNVLRSMDRGIISADTVVTYLFLYLLPCIAECFVVFLMFYFRFGEPVLSVIIFVHVVLYLVITLELTIWRKKFRKATNKHDNEFHDRATDSLINYETVKYFGNEDHETDRYVESVRKYQQYNVATQNSLALLNSVQALIIQGCLLLALFLASWKVAHGDISIGTFSAINAYVMQLFAPLSFLGTIYDMVVQSFVDMQNLSELLAENADVKDAPGAAELELRNAMRGATIEFKDVCFRYPEQRSGRGLDKVSFTIAPGTTTAIVGTTGAGKSTIARLFFRFYDVNDGSITIDGQDIRYVSQRSLRRAIGVVPQDTVMFNESLIHNIKYGNLHASTAQVEDACRKAQILDFILSLKAQWETKVGERGLRLSGGEKQRVAIARALLKDPPIVLLDEATSALDTVKEQEIQGALRSLEKGRTTLVIAHRLSTVMHAEQIIVLEEGRIIERGRHAELLALGGKYAQLWAQQAAAAEEEEKPAAGDEAGKGKAGAASKLH